MSDNGANGHPSYCNMDFVYVSSIRGTKVICILLSYDVICQWKKKFWIERLPHLPEDLQPSIPEDCVDLAVPKFHLVAHESACHPPHSLSYKVSAGETDSEGIERNWSVTNGVAASTREGAGARHDTIDDHCGYANWRKTVGLGTCQPTIFLCLLHH